MNKLKRSAIRAILALGILSAGVSVQAQEIYLQGGTQGGGIGAAFGMSNWFGLRADINAFGLPHSFTAGGNTYDAHLRILQGGGYLDVFPFAGSTFRLSGGLLINADRLSGNAIPVNGAFTLNGNRYPALPGAYVSATVKYPSTMPYFGVGFGHKPVGRGFGLVADLGVAYGRPRANLSVSPDLSAAAGSDVQGEEQQIRESMQRYRFYPILQFGASYRF